jgi:hypothetical protein
MSISPLNRDLHSDYHVKFNEISGHRDTVKPRLHLKIGALLRNNYHTKIGITNDPHRRWNQSYKNNGWHRMHVIYVSSSIDYVKDIERHIIKRFATVGCAAWYYNTAPGGEGRPCLGPYYVYLVTAPPYARITY